ncbi:hypothetical protein CK203_055785 [Vitis vinifera]|uniref:Uncharacterized protein n=1 Tax=Vitis vinifera TaxID=29760 RepID=A0A438H1U3_VITVI|nr:hypothetical protein CK203_055785 [Vitis vinifera]
MFINFVDYSRLRTEIKVHQLIEHQSIGHIHRWERITKVKEYLKAIKQQFETSDKALTITIMTKMCSMKFNGIKGVREDIMEMKDIAAQLKSLEIEMSK